MGKILNDLKKKYKDLLIAKMLKVKQENKYLKKEIQEQVLEKRKLYDEISNKQRIIRDLELRYEKEMEERRDRTIM